MKHTLITIALALLALTAAHAQQYVPTPENLAAREQFRDDKFGIFIHWGVYSMLGQGEWAMTNHNINRDEYAKLPSGFYPSRFDADAWVKAIADAGARYICFTSRHHDGFSMWDTQYSDYNIVDATPYGRDILKELSDACQKYGVHLHLYYSHLDWYRDDYYPLGRTGRGTGRTTHGSWDTYYEFMNNQLTELLTHYAPIRALWFDGVWDQPEDFDWRLPEQYAMIHEIAPACLIANNHHRAIVPGEDLQIFERDLPGENTAGYSGGQSISALPLETCQTMNGMWGYQITDQNYKSARDLIHYLVRAAGRNANLLLNVGPQPNGELPALALDRLHAMGEWLRANGETVYGTRGGDVPPHDWGVTTRKGDRLYVHILDLSDRGLFLPLTGVKVLSAVQFSDRTPVKYTQTRDGVFLTFPAVPTDTDYIIELTLKNR